MVVIPEMNSLPIEIIGDFESCTSRLTSVVVFTNEEKLYRRTPNTTRTTAMTTGETRDARMNVIIILRNESRKKLNKNGIDESISWISEVHLFRITPEGVVSKKLIGLLRMFQTIVLKMFSEAELATNPRQIAVITRKMNENIPMNP